ncbi:Regulator of G-protein signaling 7-binding protein [Holothuria leucospilota]|uniref:Regulator of G-protein signaling 7-binding protein n=1 Tax=Holothuria leucospilota TaxID=206669 RepID=A0A9Q1H190_HOLLE|nr:Regulator of G-protein signaling 7-binding protein [Holothuria leucospilota]
MNSGIIPQRVSAVAPTLASPTGLLRPASARSYQSTAKTPSVIKGPPNTEEEEEVLLELIEECERLTREFNVRVALYREKLRQLGDVGDGATVREETRQQRQRGVEAAKIASIALSPHIKNSSIAREEFDRIFVQLTGCMEHFLMEMKKGVFLVQKFPCERLQEPDFSALPGVILTDSDCNPSSSDVSHNCSNNSQSRQGPSSGRSSVQARQQSDWLEGGDSNDVILTSSPTLKHDVDGIIRDIQEIETILREITGTDMGKKQKVNTERATPSILSEIFQPSSINKFRRRLGSCCCLPSV